MGRRTKILKNSISDEEPYCLLSFNTSGVKDRFFLFPAISLEIDLSMEELAILTDSITSSETIDTIFSHIYLNEAEIKY